MTLPDGVNRLNSTVAIARFVAAIPVQSRAWNVKKGKTAGMEKLAEELLENEEIFGEEYPEKDRPKKTTLIKSLGEMHLLSLKAAKEYEDAVKDLDRASAFTFVTSKDGDILELNSVQKLVNMQVRGFVIFLLARRLTRVLADAQIRKETDSAGGIDGV